MRVAPSTLACLLVLAPFTPAQEPAYRGEVSDADYRRAVADGLDWLARHQSDDGAWDSDGFSANCGAPKHGAPACDGFGHARNDVGVTSLALLAFVEDGHTTRAGKYRPVVQRALRWLLEQQDADTGLIGTPSSHSYHYDHAIATLALCEEALAGSHDEFLGAAKRALDYVFRSRNPYGAWRYDSPPIGDNDTSITSWMIAAIEAGERCGISIDRAAYEGALAWVDEVTDPESARVGYDSMGSLSSRTLQNEHFPREKGEAMTAAGISIRHLARHSGSEGELVGRYAARLQRRLPVWDPTGFGVDMYYWFHGTRALRAVGGDAWKSWRAALGPAVYAAQRLDAEAKGSWDPVGPWGYAGGRVYSTALMVLCLEARAPKRRAF